MKKIIIFAFLMLATFVSFGQKPIQGTISLENTIQTTFAVNRDHTTGMGLSGKIEKEVFNKTFISLNLGFINYNGGEKQYSYYDAYNKRYIIGKYDVPLLRTRFIGAGIKFKPENNFYVNLDVSYFQFNYFNNYQQRWHDCISISPGIGYTILNRVDIGMQYNHILELHEYYGAVNSFSDIFKPSIFNNLTFKIGYRFNISKEKPNNQNNPFQFQQF